MVLRLGSLLGFSAAALSCGRWPAPAPGPVRDLDGPARLVLTERWRDRGRLVIVDETGDRLAPLLVPGVTADGAHATDEHPAFSPDGRWIAFASNRESEADGRSLWLVAARADGIPVRLTRGSRDVDPSWDGAGALLFASDRAGEGSFDLYRLTLERGASGAVTGAPQRLTDAPTHELAPSAAAGRVVVQVVDVGAGRSWVAERTADGALLALTDGPADGSPALSPDGRLLAFAGTRVHADGERDLDVLVVPLDDGGRAAGPAGLELDGTDEGAPAWSIDGRWLFATSILRDSDGQPLLPSVIYRDTTARKVVVRMLRDAAGAPPRLGVALAPVVLDPEVLGKNLDHLKALRHAFADLAEAAERDKKR